MKQSMTALATLFGLGLMAHTAGAADLRMSWWGGDSRHIATQEALKVCGEKYGHTISPEFTGFSGHLEKLTTQLAGGTEADIMQVNWPWLPLFSINGDGFANLRDYADIIDLTQWSDSNLDAGSMNGVLNGLPVSTTGRVFMFNKSSFEKAGLQVPQTWDDLIAAAAVFREKLGEGAYPYDASGLNAVLTVSLIATQETGKDMIDPATNQVAWTKEELAEAITFYQMLVDKGVIRSWKTSAGEGNVALFENPLWAEGTIAGSYEWDSTYFKYSDPISEGQDLVPVKILQIDDAKTEGVYRKPSMVFSISKRSKDPQAAAQVLNCMLNEPEGVAALGDSRGLPASAVAAKTLADAGSIDPILLEANQMVMDGTGPTVSPFNEHPEVRSVFTDTLEQFAYGQMSADEAAQEMIDGINDVLSSF